MFCKIFTLLFFLVSKSGYWPIFFIIIMVFVPGSERFYQKLPSLDLKQLIAPRLLTQIFPFLTALNLLQTNFFFVLCPELFKNNVKCKPHLSATQSVATKTEGSIETHHHRNTDRYQSFKSSNTLHERRESDQQFLTKEHSTVQPNPKIDQNHLGQQNKNLSQKHTDQSYSAMENSNERSSSAMTNLSNNKDLQYLEKFNGIFVVDGKIYKYSINSLHCMTQHSRIRQLCVKIIVNKCFDGFIIFCILLNTIALASKEYRINYDVHYKSKWNSFLDVLDLIFSIIFLVECVLKVIGMGFIRHKHAYLRNGWNWIDFIIVVVSVIGFTPISDDSSLKVFRTMRILRPLRSMHKLKSMKNLLNTFFASIPGLFNVCIFLVFIFTIFSIVAVNFFSGSHYQFCRSTEELVNDGVNKPYWPINEDAAWLCSSDEMCSGYPNYLGDGVLAKCGDIYRDYNLPPREFDDTYNNEMINFDITNFNDVLASSLTIFQVITLEGWSQLMYNYQDAVSPVTSSLYFAFVIILGAFTTLNLVLASIMHSFLKQAEKQKNNELQQNLDKQQTALAVKQLISSTGERNTSSMLLAGKEEQEDAQNQSQTLSYKKCRPLFNENLSIIQEQSISHGIGVQSSIRDDNSALDLSHKVVGLERNSVRISHESEPEQVSSKKSGNKTPKKMLHLPDVHGNTLTKFQGIMAHQDLEDRVPIDGAPMMSMASFSERSVLRSGSVEKESQSYIQRSIHKSNSSLRDSIEKSKMQTPSSNNVEKQVNDCEQLLQIIEANAEGSKSNISSPRHHTSLEQVSAKKSFMEDTKIPISNNESTMSNISAVTDQQDLLEFNAEERAQKNCFYSFFYEIVTSVTFNFLIYCFILANTITLALYRYDQSDDQANVLQILNHIFVWVFFAEMIAKMIGLGLRNYARDKFNVFDCIIVIVSLVDFGLEFGLGSDNGTDAIMSAFRALRLLRVVKLARHWKAFQEILRTMISSLIDIANFSLLLFLCLFIFALLGMELFAFTAYEDRDGELVFGARNIQSAYERGDTLMWPRTNFNNIFNSLVTVFIVIIAEDWNGYMYMYVRALGAESEVGRSIAILYFIVLFIVGNTIMLALFTAILLKSQDADIETLTRLIDEREKRAAQKALKQNSIYIKDRTICQNCKRKCSCVEWQKRWKKFSDSFVKVFGGASALMKRRNLRRKKNPKLNASPSSGNAVTPLPITQQPSVVADTNAKKTIQVYPIAEESSEQEAKRKNPKDNAAEDKTPAQSSRLSLFASEKSDLCLSGKKEQARLSRPHALLHYDFSQEVLTMDPQMIKQQSLRLNGRSLHLFNPNNMFRKICARVAMNFWFDMFIILLILASTISLAFEHPLQDPNSEKMKILNKVDIAFTTIFTLEAILKIIALGFLLNGKRSYLREQWNILDFIIVVFSCFGLVIQSDISVVKVLRVARILRPLRLIQRAEGLKIATMALFKSIPQIVRLQVVISFMMFMISILMTSLLSGKLYSCNMGHASLSFAQESEIKNRWECLNYGGQWVNAPLNFDNTLQGMLTLYIFQTREGWVGLMENSIDAVGVDLVGERGRNVFYVVLYMVLVIILCLLFMNMIVRIVIQTYNMQKDFISFNRLLSDQQRSWIQVQIMTYAVKPKVELQADSSYYLRNLCIKVQRHRHFENFIMMCILLNTLIMALTWFDPPKELPETIEIFNYVFMTIFTLEAIIKLIALKGLYFRDSWNIFDFTIVTITLIMLFLKIINVEVPFGNGPTVLRALRIGRILRLIKRAKKLKIIFHTLLDSAASLGSLGLLLVIIFFMFAIIGRSVFGLTEINGAMEELNDHVNFRDFGTSFLLLLRCSTGESWHMIMFDYARSYSPQYQCREGEDYELMMANGGEPKGCGSALYAYTFFIGFNIFFQVFINLFVAIIIDAFLGQTDHFQLPIQNYQLLEFVNIWSQFDPTATGFIKIEDLDELIVRLANSRDAHELIILYEQMMVDEEMRQRFITMLNIPTYKQMKYVMFYDVLQQLCDKVNLLKFTKPRNKEEKARSEAMKKMGIKHVKDELQILMTTNNTNAIDFEQTVRQMGKLNPKIKLMMLLQQGFKRVHETYAVYVDSKQSIEYPDEMRRQMTNTELRQHNLVERSNQADVDVLTTRHYFAGKVVQRSLRRMLSRARRNIAIRRSGEQLNAGNATTFNRSQSQPDADIQSLQAEKGNTRNFKTSKKDTGNSQSSHSNTNLLVERELERMQKEEEPI